ncbi:MAG: GGDEF domain-containing protein [Bacilli bacterium]|nr:GGDEF domain-containing protein [Bacilli bacterium]
MKNIKKIVLIISLTIVVIGGIIFAFFKLFKDENNLTISEKTWINNNKNSVYTVYVPNDVNVFGKSGNGVYFDFISDLDEELGLKLNSTVYSVDSSNDSFGFNVSTNYDNRDLLMYVDYYVLVSQDNNTIVDLDSLNNKNIGIISTDLSYVSTYYNISGTIKTYDSSDALFTGFKDKEVDYIIVPLNRYKDKVISLNYNVSYFFNDAKVYYYLHLSNDKTLNSIVTKYYNNWMKEEYNDSYNDNNYDLFIKCLNITDIEEDALTDKTYSFEYVVSQPYQLLSRGNFTGIVSEYLNKFTEFSEIEFKYNKVKNFNNLKYDIDKKKVDLYFNMYNYDRNYNNINVNLPINYYLISNRKISINIDSLNAYEGIIYVEENSLLYNYLSNFKNITVKTFDKTSKIKRIINKDNVVIVDKLYYDNYLIDSLNEVHIILSDTINKTYTFNYKNNNDVFYRLFRSYVNTLNPKEVIDNSLHEYFETYEAGSRSVKLAKYIILLIIVILIGVYLIIRNKKKIVLNTKVKNNEKIRYVDMLTSLKNRNYLNDRIEIWNQNTVYPQGVIVLDLNNVKYLNDTFGHEEGDKQIKAAANILFKTQLENTELIRTDGNEFMIYLVGYSEKQVISYIKKLLKEFKDLPYEYGVAVGFSMINDDLKLIEDAFNEATLQMRENKKTFEDEDEE